MNPILEGRVAVAFVMAGVSGKTGNPYLQVSNGIEAFFIDIRKQDKDLVKQFASLEEGDVIEMVISQRAGAARAKLIDYIGAL